MKERLHYLDTLKGILIVLVILGHVIQANIDSYQEVFLFRFIYSFHMPLFFFISGFLTFRKSAKHGFIAKRARQCLIPFATWALLTPLIKTGNFDMQQTLQTLLYPNNGLWFLYNLFIYCALMECSERWSSKHIKQEYWFAGIALALFAASALLHTLLNATPLSWYLPFFALGYYVRKYDGRITKHQDAILLSCGIVFLITVPFWMMRTAPTFYRWIDLGGGFAYLYRCMVSVAGTLFFFMAGRKYLNGACSLVEKTGTKTLGIYAFQFVVLYGLESTFRLDNLFLQTALQTTICFILSLTLTVVTERVKYLRLLLIGAA